MKIEVTLPNSIYEALIPKPDKDTKRRELQTKISDEDIDAKLSTKHPNENQMHIKKISNQD